MTPREQSRWFWRDVRKALMIIGTVSAVIIVICSCIWHGTLVQLIGRLVIPALCITLAGLMEIDNDVF